MTLYERIKRWFYYQFWLVCIPKESEKYLLKESRVKINRPIIFVSLLLTLLALFFSIHSCMNDSSVNTHQEIYDSCFTVCIIKDD
jgi:hypothetical protein